jgi:riboflavin kinase / FMN adenylyltransferase
VLRRTAPLAGFFAVEAEGIAGGKKAGVASVGRRPTVNPVPIPLLEVHLFDWDGDLYGSHIKVRFLKKLRDEKKYDGLPALQAAIAADAKQAREFFQTNG